MDTATIYYFSGTGNAQWVARWCQHELESNKIRSTIHHIADKNCVEHPPEKSLIGFCFPTHGFNVIPAMLHFIIRFPKANNQSVFLVNTRAGMKLSKLFIQGLSGAALFLPALILLFKGYKIAGMRSIDLPSNWISLHPGLRKKVVDSMFTHWEKKTRTFIQRLIKGKKVYRGMYDFPIDILLVPVAVLYYFIGRFGLAKTFMPNNQCNNCNICIDHCPFKAIKTKNNRPYWTFRCESCMQCMNNCPKNAIQTTHALTVYSWHYLIIGAGVMSGLFLKEFMPGLNSNNGWANFLMFCIESALGLGLIWLVYYISHYLLRFYWFERLVYYTSLTNFKFWRYYKPPGKKSRQKIDP